MSASTDKKNRQAARAAGTDKKMLAAQEAAKKQKQEKRRWTLGTILVVVLIALLLVLNYTDIRYSHTALKVGDDKLSIGEVNYYYGNAYTGLVNQYGNYAAAMGLDTSAGIAGMRNQPSMFLENGTWRDYFLQTAEQDIIQMIALKEYAAANGITLTDDEAAATEASFDGLDSYVQSLGYRSANAFFTFNYGKGVNLAIARQAALDQALAQKAYTHYVDSLEFSDEELEAQYASYNGSRDMFAFLVYDVKAAVAEGAEAPDEQAVAEAAAIADAIAAAYQDGSDIEDVTERFEVAVDSQTGETGEVKPTSRSNVSGGSLSADYSEWMMDEARAAGDVTVAADGDGSGTSVIVFLSRSDNHYRTASVRHILVMAEADAEGNYTDEAKAAAKARAEEILAEYEAGEHTAEAFAALAEQYSEDSGSNRNGGLYENIAKGQMVPEFDAFCFEGHEEGDTAIVYGESASYAGYHVMYYVGEGELYSNVIAENDLGSTAVGEWMAELTAPYSAEETFWIRRVG